MSHIYPVMKFHPSFLFLPLVMANAAQAAPVAHQDFHALRGRAGAWLEAQAMQAYPGTLAMVAMGPVDERLRLPACAEPRFFLPNGVRPWGHGSLGVRCEGEAKWGLYLSFDARLRGPALVATRALPAKAVPGTGDLESRLMDYRQPPETYLREYPAGAQLLRPLAAGQPLLLGGISQPDVIKAGQKVRAIASGSGFQAAQEGTALGNAAPGDTIKVRMPSGRIVHGVATPEGQVTVSH